MTPPTVLLLAGTLEAREFAEKVMSRVDLRARIRLVASLAGVTAAPAPLPCDTRVGGFGGAEAMAKWLRAEQVAAVIDATHPFAAAVTHNAVSAAEAAEVPFLRLERPPWNKPEGARWREVASHQKAAEAPPAGARVLLTTGARTLAPYAAREDVWWGLRVMDQTALPSPRPFAQGAMIENRPGASISEETALMQAHGVTHLITKNAGGAGARAKVDAAAALGLETILIRRPEPPPNTAVVGDVAAALAWLEDHVP
ncbi:MAG: cobalt-precorrin-6A reductase [Rhodobacteraceae bacterium]|nr:cobalt-precorrin-6A reductase [Paracoccaceae bacterium]